MSEHVKFRCPGCNLVISSEKFEIHVNKFCANPFKATREAGKIIQLLYQGTHAEKMEAIWRVDVLKDLHAKP